MDTFPRGLPLRELGLLPRLAAQRGAQFTPQAATELLCQHILDGHTGCVNRLAWNAAGDRLLSGSDDTKLIMWPFNDPGQPALMIDTHHRANVFGVQFLPMSNNTRLVSCSMDHTVQYHELPPADLGTVAYRPMTGGSIGGFAPGAVGGAGGDAARMKVVHQRTTVYSCHRARVKDVEVEPLNPHNFWSAGEDGYVRQFDTRVSTAQQCGFRSPNVLIHACSGGQSLEVKAVDVCATRPHLLAVACDDPFVRIYDRRMLRLTAPSTAGLGDSLSDGGTGVGEPVLRLAPAHLRHMGSVASGRYGLHSHTTYTAFSHCGDRIVANYHGDHAYAFDVTGAGCTAAVYPINVDAPVPHSPAAHEAVTWEEHGWWRSPAAPLPVCSPLYVWVAAAPRVAPRAPQAWDYHDAGLSYRTEQQITKVEMSLFTKDWSMAHRRLTRAIALAPWAPRLRLKRGEVLLKRGWPADALWALSDADAALMLHEARVSSGAEPAVSGKNYRSSILDNLRSGNTGGPFPLWRVHMVRAQALHAMGQTQTAIGALLACEQAAPTDSHSRSEVQQLWKNLMSAKEKAQGRRNGTSGGRGVAQGEGMSAENTALHESFEQWRNAGAGRGAAPGTSGPVAGGAGPSDWMVSEDGTDSEEEMSVEGDSEDDGMSDEGTDDADMSEGWHGDTGSDSDKEGEGRREWAPPGRDTSGAAPAHADGLCDYLRRAKRPKGTLAAHLPQPSQPPQPPQVPGGASSAPGVAASSPGYAEEGPGAALRGLLSVTSLSSAGASHAAGGSNALGLEPGSGRALQGHAQEPSGPISDAGVPVGAVASPSREHGGGSGSGDGSGSAAGDSQGQSQGERPQAQPEKSSRGGGHGRSASDDDPRDCVAGPGSDEPEPFIGPMPERPRRSHARATGGSGAAHKRRWQGTRDRAARDPAGGPSPTCDTWGAQLVSDFMPGGRRLLQRYVGHCNVQTDIKEVNFLGQGDELIATGSDDGRVLIYHATTGELLVALEADEDVVNCVQPHPHLTVLASSGIESTVSLWGVGGHRSRAPVARRRLARTARDQLDGIVAENQSRSQEGPQVLRGPTLSTLVAEHPHLLQLLMELRGSRQPPGDAADEDDELERGGGDGEGSDGDDPDGPGGDRPVSCRVN